MRRRRGACPGRTARPGCPAGAPRAGATAAPERTATRVAGRVLHSAAVPRVKLRGARARAAADVLADPTMFKHLRDDIACILERDPAARSTLEVLTCYPGLHA
ncbi:MAG: hypothetical protein MUC74_12535, partial [Ideonella sp.]|nr:hypothetical protein [Ideonella sp.]